MPRQVCLLTLGVSLAAAQDGAAIYRHKCAECHAKPEGRVPPLSALRTLDPAKVLLSMESGVMKPQASGLSSAEKHALTVYIVTPDAAKRPEPPRPAFCADS